MMQQGLSASLGTTPLPSKPEPEAQSGKASSEMVAALEQRLQLLSEEAGQLRETIVKQAGLHPCMAHALHFLEMTADIAPRPVYCSVRLPQCIESCCGSMQKLKKGGNALRHAQTNPEGMCCNLPAVAGVTLLATLQEFEKQAAVAAAREEGKASAAEQVGKPMVEKQLRGFSCIMPACNLMMDCPIE